MLKTFVNWLRDLDVYDIEDLGLLVLKGFFVLAIITWITMTVGFICLDSGISFLWAPIIVFTVLIGSFLVGILMNYLNITK